MHMRAKCPSRSAAASGRTSITSNDGTRDMGGENGCGFAGPGSNPAWCSPPSSLDGSIIHRMMGNEYPVSQLPRRGASCAGRSTSPAALSTALSIRSPGIASRDLRVFHRAALTMSAYRTGGAPHLRPFSKPPRDIGSARFAVVARPPDQMDCGRTSPPRSDTCRVHQARASLLACDDRDPRGPSDAVAASSPCLQRFEASTRHRRLQRCRGSMFQHIKAQIGSPALPADAAHAGRYRLGDDRRAEPKPPTSCLLSIHENRRCNV